MENPSDHSVYSMVSIMVPLFHGLHGFRPGPMDPWSRPRRLAKDQDLLIKLVSLERTLKGIGCFDGGLS